MTTAYRSLRQKPVQTNVPVDESNRKEITYTRVSTTNQTLNNTESLEMQLAQKGDGELLIEGLQPDGSIKGVSGTKSIEERPMLQEAIRQIYEVRAQGGEVLLKVASVSRLFRTKSRVPVETFIDICKANDVRIKTKVPDMTFDFNVYGMDDLFRSQYDFSRKYIEIQIEAMHQANAQKAGKGLYHGRPLVPGYIVERVKVETDKGIREVSKGFIPYIPHREVVERLFKRFRELGGQFNLLWNEVAQKTVVFPAFESWVDHRDIKKFRLRQVKNAEGKLLGYHISRVGLFHLMTSVEYMGYWKTGGKVMDDKKNPVKEKNSKGKEVYQYYSELLTDASGQPIKTHEAIVDAEDWQYAFDKLSWVKLDGSKNRDAMRTWTPATSKGKERAPRLLQGIMTSPLGLVQYTDGQYRVYELKGPNTSRRVNTLTVSADWIEVQFMRRLESRIENTDYQQVLTDALLNAQAKNEKSLVSVDEQIEKARTSISNQQAGLAKMLAVLGDKVSVETVEKINADIQEDQDKLNELLTKKNAAIADEEQLRELTTLLDYCLLGKVRSNPSLRRFITLATDSIELSEYSSHVLTLTVHWSAPFASTDVCYFYRADGGHQKWSTKDEQDLREL